MSKRSDAEPTRFGLVPRPKPQAPTQLSPQTWLISDTHFGHVNIREYCQRPADCDEQMKANWKTLVGRDDDIWHLGDVMLPRREYGWVWQEWVTKLPGRKHLIRGNHDHRLSRAKFEAMGFEIHDQRVWLDQPDYGRVVLSHHPYIGPEPFTMNIHGHVHNNPYASTLRGYRNISVEVTAYAPVRLADVLAGTVGRDPDEQGFWLTEHDPERGRPVAKPLEAEAEACDE